MTAISADNEERATRVKSGQSLPQRRFAYEFRLASAREWSLSFSAGGGDRSPELEERSLLAEPALFLVRHSGMICRLSGQTIHFARPICFDIVGVIGYVLANLIPRGVGRDFERGCESLVNRCDRRDEHADAGRHSRWICRLLVARERESARRNER